MGKIIRRCIAVLLCATAIILILIPSEDASATTTKGDFELDGSTLVSYIGHDTEVTIPNTITEIGDDAFSKNDALYKVVIPDSVKSIGHSAFEGCTNLTKVSIGSSVKKIGSEAFADCVNLQNVNIPAKCSDLGSGVFAGCNSLSSVSIDSSNRNYTCVDGVIYTKDGSTLVQYLAGRPSSTYSMPATVSEIGEYAFWGADSLSSASVSSQVKEIPEYAFSNCESLNKVTLPSSVESLMAFSFADCPSLTKIQIPDSVGYIDEKAFYLTNGATLDFVDSDGNTTDSVAVSDVEGADDMGNAQSEDDSDNNSGDSDVSESENTADGSDSSDDTYTPSYSGDSNWVTKIKSRDFADNKSANELGSGMIVGGNAMFIMSPDMPVKGYDIEDAEAEDSLAQAGGNTSLRGETFEIIDGVLAAYNGTDENVSIPSNVNKIGERAFYKNENIKTVSIPSSVTEIDDFAFARTNLESVDIPSGVKRIGYAAFYQCPELENVSIPDSVDEIELGAFDGSKWLNEWLNSDDGNAYLTVGDGILLSYKGDGGNISLPEGTKQIAAGCFDTNENITGVNIPNGTQKIGEDAFNSCVNLSSLTLPDGLTAIEDRAFGSTALTAVNIPDSVSSIGLGAFDSTGNGSMLKTVILEGSDVPNVTYKDTATRLSAKDLRTDAFNGVENMIVKSDCNLDSGTLLNPKYYGFHGQVYCVSPDSTDEQGLLSLLKTTKRPDEQGNVNIDSHVQIGSEEYVMSGAKEHAFDDYLNYNEWCDVKPSSVVVSGNASDDLNSLLGDIVSNISEEPKTESGITVITEGNDLGSSAKASIDGYDDHAVLTITEEEGNREALMKGLYSFYGGDTNVSLIPLELSLFDNTGTIAIHKLGDSKMDVSIEVPQMFEGSDSIKAASLDNDGALTELPTGLSSENGKEYINFVANHCSKYAIYIKNESTYVRTDSETTAQDMTDGNETAEGDISMPQDNDPRKGRNDYNEEDVVEVTSISNTDEINAGNFTVSGIINTLNKSEGNISVKWFIIIILLALAMILFLYKPSKKRG